MNFTSHSFNPYSYILTRMKENKVSQVCEKPSSSKNCTVVQHACPLVVLHKVVQSCSLLFGGIKTKCMKTQRKYSSLVWFCTVKGVFIRVSLNWGLVWQPVDTDIRHEAATAPACSGIGNPQSCPAYNTMSRTTTTIRKITLFSNCLEKNPSWINRASQRDIWI